MSCTLIAAEPGLGTAKQVLDAKWQKLRPNYAKERNVLFRSIRYLGASGTSYQYQISAFIRDYDPGYPANRYYGRTCVGTIQDLRYTLWSDGVQWQVDGVMTPPQSKCQDNPSAGVSSVPVASLAGTPAAAGRPAAAPPPPRSGGMVQGAYECWAGGSARMTFNFTVQAGSQYVDSEGKRGSFSVDPANSRVTFRGGLLDGGIPAGMYAVYHEPKGRPTLSFRGRDGGEALFCEK